MSVNTQPNIIGKYDGGRLEATWYGALFRYAVSEGAGVRAFFYKTGDKAEIVWWIKNYQYEEMSAFAQDALKASGLNKRIVGFRLREIGTVLDGYPIELYFDIILEDDHGTK